MSHEKEPIIYEASGAVNPILAALIVNAWYSAQNIHLAERGTLTAEEKERLLADVIHWNGQILKLIEDSKGSPSPNQKMREHLKRIF